VVITDLYKYSIQMPYHLM